MCYIEELMDDHLREMDERKKTCEARLCGKELDYPNTVFNGMEVIHCCDEHFEHYKEKYPEENKFLLTK